MSPSTPRAQLDLFGPGDRAEAPRTAVGAAEVPDRLRQVARRLPSALRLGTSSWSFPGWAGIVYDRGYRESVLARAGLAAYAEHPLLRTVSVDRTYYAPLPAADLADYAASVPSDFRFLVKAWSECTAPVLRDGRPNPHRLDPAFAAEEVVGPYAEGLADRGGALVFQFPPQGGDMAARPADFAEELAGFLEKLPRGPRYAVELRDRELFGEAYVDALAASGATHVLNLHPRMPAVSDQWGRARRLDGPVVVRWMLHGGLGYERAVERYRPFTRIVDADPANRAALAGLCREALPGGRDVFVAANNKAEGSAPLSVFALAEAITDAITEAITEETP